MIIIIIIIIVYYAKMAADTNMFTYLLTEIHWAVLYQSAFVLRMMGLCSALVSKQVNQGNIVTSQVRILTMFKILSLELCHLTTPQTCRYM